MARSLAQTIFMLSASALLLALCSHPLRAQGLSSFAASTEGESHADKSLPDITALVHDSDVHGASMHRDLNDYTYTLIKVKRTLDPRGRVTSEKVQAFEAYPVQGQHVLIQISENGTALSLREVAEERRIAGEQLERAERNALRRANENAAANLPAATAAHLAAAPAATAAPAPAPTPANIEPGRHILAGVYGAANGRYANVVIDLSEFLRSCEFSAPRPERIGGRDAVALSFRPRADARFPAHLSFISKLSGTVWIDLADKVVVRLEGWPMPAAANAPQDEKNAPHDAQAAALAKQPEPAKQPEAAIIYQQVRLSTGVWVPSLIRMNAGGNAALFNGLNWDVVFEFKDYKRFTADVGGVEFDRPTRLHGEKRPL